MLKSLQEMKQRGNQQWCKTDINNYTALANRWRNQRHLKVWWASRTANQKAVWFQQEQAHVSGSKRAFDSISYCETASQQQVSSRRAILNHVSLTTFIRYKFQEGIGRAEAIAEFGRIVNEQPQTCVHENGQWHVPDYFGISSATGQDNSQGFQLGRSANVDNTSALQALLAGGQQMLASATTRRMQNLTPRLPAMLPDAPHIVANPADAAPNGNPDSTAVEAVSREAYVLGKIVLIKFVNDQVMVV